MWCLCLIVLYFEFSIVFQISYMQRRNQNGGRLPAIAAVSLKTLGHRCRTGIRPRRSCIRPMEKVVLIFDKNPDASSIICCICVEPVNLVVMNVICALNYFDCFSNLKCCMLSFLDMKLNIKILLIRT